MPDKDARSMERRGQGRDMQRFGGGWDPSEFFRNPFAVMRRMHDEMDRSFSDMWGGQTGGGWSPAVEVHEKDGNYVVRAELPGMKPEDVNVEMTDQGLVIHGERKQEKERDEGGFHRTERRYGSFYRVIPLPEGIDPEKAHADFKDGMLEVRMPVPERKETSRRIPIGGSSSGQTEKERPKHKESPGKAA